MLVPNALWDPVVSQYSGFLTGEPLLEGGHMYLVVIRAHRNANSGLGSLMPLVSTMMLTRNQADYGVYRLNVVNEYVGRPNGLFGGFQHYI